MISLEGLTLATNRLAEAGWILRNFWPLFARWIAAQPVPRGSARGFVPYGGRHAVVLPRAGSV